MINAVFFTLMTLQILTKNFSNTLFDLLKEYDSQNFNLMISGGSILQHLDDDRYNSIDTTKWNVFFADERCNKEFSNFQDAKEFLRRIKGKIYHIEILNNPEESARIYEEKLKENAQTINLCLLGVGDNGHICSLWPESPDLETKKQVQSVTVDCKVSPQRITVTLSFLNNHVKNLFFVIPPRNGKPKKVKEPHPNIKEKLKIDYISILPEY